MKLLVLSLALIGSILAMPVDDVSTQTSSDQPIALPALDAKSAAQPVDQHDNTADQHNQDNNKSDTSTEDTKPAGKSETPINSEAPQASKGDNVPISASLPLLSQADNKDLNIKSQETKRETNLESESKSNEADQTVNQPALASIDNDRKNVPLSVNIGEAASKLASITEDNIPPVLESGSIPNPEKKIDIVPCNQSSQTESNKKSEGSANQEKRDLESNPINEHADNENNEQKNNNGIATEQETKNDDSEKKTNNRGIVISQEPRDDDGSDNRFAYEGTKTTTLKNASPKLVISHTATGYSASKPADTEGVLAKPIAGFTDDSIRRIRDTVDEAKDGKDTKIEAASPVSPKVDEPVKTEDTSKKQDSAESNESKDEESSVSHRTNNSSQEDSSEEKDEKKQGSDNNASPISSVKSSEPTTKSNLAEKLGEPTAKP